MSTKLAHKARTFCDASAPNCKDPERMFSACATAARASGTTEKVAAPIYFAFAAARPSRTNLSPLTILSTTAFFASNANESCTRFILKILVSAQLRDTLQSHHAYQSRSASCSKRIAEHLHPCRPNTPKTHSVLPLFWTRRGPT